MEDTVILLILNAPWNRIREKNTKSHIEVAIDFPSQVARPLLRPQVCDLKEK